MIDFDIIANNSGRHVVNVDWLQFHCFDMRGDVEPKLCRLRALNMGVKFFGCAHEVIYNDEILATLYTEPKGGVLQSNSCSLKVYNAVLYREDAETLIDMMFADLRIIPHNVTRLDLCADSIAFVCGMMPEAFLREVMAGRIVPNAKSKFHIIGSSNGGLHPETLRLGSRKSSIGAYLYNKTKELNEVHDKPYIRECWPTEWTTSGADVWRVELSMHDSKFSAVDECGELFEVANWRKLFNQQDAVAIFDMLCHRWFSFKYRGIDSNKSRWKDVALFTTERGETRRVRMSEKSETDRATRMTASAIIRTKFGSKGVSDEVSDALDTLAQYMTEYKNLGEYLEYLEEKWRGSAKR